MKATQYITAPNWILKPTVLQPAGSAMNGICTLQVASKPRKEPFDGFGVAITGSSCYQLNTMPTEQRRAFLQDIYGTDGLGLSVGRLSVGASDYSAELYSYDDIPGDRTLTHFSISRDEVYILPMIREILDVCPSLLLFASPWSPPGWMKTGGSLCGGFMREEFLDCYADYLVKFVQAYAAAGVPLQALTPQNETETDQMGRMPACLWHPDFEARFAIALRSKLDAADLDTKIWLYDHNFSNWKRVQWSLQEYPNLTNSIAGIAWHYYYGGAEMLDTLHSEYPDLAFHFTEGGPRLNDHYADDWCKWGLMMTKALNHGCRTFTGWNLLLDEKGGPNLGPFFCGGLATRNSQTGELTYSGQYRALQHFSRYVRPGARLFATSVQDDAPPMWNYPHLGTPLEVCAAENTDGRFVLTVANPHEEKRQLQYFHGGSWWYMELLPDSLSTVVFE